MRQSPAYDVEIEISEDMYNPVYLPYLHQTRPTEIFYGGSSSGKSFFLAQRAIEDVLAGGHNYLCCRKRGNSISKSVFNELVKAIFRLHATHLFNIVPSQGHITCVNGYQILFSGLDDVEKIKSITPKLGVITDIWVEEATEAALSDIKQLRKRLRGKAAYDGRRIRKRVILSFNPIYRTHWIVKEYFAGWKDNETEYLTDSLSILKTTHKDNLFLDDDDHAELEAETDPYWYQVYTLGNWGILGDTILTNWRTEDLTKRVHEFDRIRNGLDFGYSSDPNAFVRVHYDRRRKRIYIFQGWDAPGLTNPQIAQRLKPYISNECIFCDSAEPKSIQELRDCGIDARPVKKGPDSLLYSIKWLQKHEIIVDEALQPVVNELNTWQWKKDKDGRSLPIPEDKNNHYCFSAGTMIRTARGDVAISKLKKSDLVLTRAGYKPIKKCGCTRRQAEIFEARFSDGTTINCTHDHPFITTENKRKKLYSLTQQDMLTKDIKQGGISWLVNQLFLAVIGIGERKKARTPSITSECLAEKKFCISIVKFTKKRMVRFLQAVKSITSMAIWTTIGQKTLNLCPGNVTNLNIVTPVQISKGKISTGSDLLQKNGTVAQKDGSGTHSTGKRHTKSVSRSLKSVSFAALFLKIFHGENQRSFAQTSVNQNIGGTPVATTKSGRVNFAERILLRISILRQKPVHVVALTATGRKENVYNLQVDSVFHEYFAEGILVSNCDALRYSCEIEYLGFFGDVL